MVLVNTEMGKAIITWDTFAKTKDMVLEARYCFWKIFFPLIKMECGTKANKWAFRLST